MKGFSFTGLFVLLFFPILIGCLWLDFSVMWRILVTDIILIIYFRFFSVINEGEAIEQSKEKENIPVTKDGKQPLSWWNLGK